MPLKEVEDANSNPGQPRSWHWYSTPATADALELSVLALVETIFAVSIYIWIASSGYTIHLAVSACIAPFLLIRTPESVELAFKLSSKLPKPLGRHTREIFFPIWVSYVGIWLFVIRLAASAITALKQPINAIKVIPTNWWRIVLWIASVATRGDFVTRLNSIRRLAFYKLRMAVGVVLIAVVSSKVIASQVGLN